MGEEGRFSLGYLDGLLVMAERQGLVVGVFMHQTCKRTTTTQAPHHIAAYMPHEALSAFRSRR